MDAPQICDLADVPVAVPRLSVLLNEEWGGKRGLSSFQVEAGIKAWCRKDAMPWGVAAFAGAEAAGIAVLYTGGLKARRYISPWLGSVFVAARYRNQGLGSALVRAVEKRAKSLGHDTLYLHTVDKESLYTRLGWEAFGTDTDRGSAVVLMRRHLGGTCRRSTCGDYGSWSIHNEPDAQVAWAPTPQTVRA